MSKSQGANLSGSGCISMRVAKLVNPIKTAIIIISPLDIRREVDGLLSMKGNFAVRIM